MIIAIIMLERFESHSSFLLVNSYPGADIHDSKKNKQVIFLPTITLNLMQRQKGNKGIKCLSDL